MNKHKTTEFTVLCRRVNNSLSYNTWRNEKTEDNRNQRHAAFEILLKINELQQVVFYYYDNDTKDKGNPRTAWSYVLTIEDLSKI